MALADAIEKGLVASCHDCSDGGLAVALAETAFAGGLGIIADISGVPAKGSMRTDYLLFSHQMHTSFYTVHRLPRGTERQHRWRPC